MDRSPARPRVVEDPAELRPWWVGALLSLAPLAGLAWVIATLLRTVDGTVLSAVGLALATCAIVGARRTRRRQREFAMRLMAAQPTPTAQRSGTPRLTS